MPMPKEIEGIHLSGSFPSLNILDEKAEFELVFSRGFLLINKSTYANSKTELKCAFEYDMREVGASHCLLLHKKLQVQSYTDGHFSIWLLGPACFTSELTTSDDAIPEYLYEKLRNSEKEFFAALNSISGTYVIIWTVNDEINIVNDAHAFRSVFYSTKTGNCSSHLELLNIVECEGESAMQIHFKRSAYDYCYQFPGNLTSYENLLFLTPNFVLRLNDVTTARFFPTEKRNSVPLYEVKRRVLDKYLTVANKFKKKHNLTMSLTGGRDSRVSLYATRTIKDEIFYFSESRDDDLLAAKKIANLNKLNWLGFDPRILDNSINPSYARFQKVLNKSVFPKNVTWALKSQFLVYNLFSSRNFLHIHSNGAESARGRTAEYEYAFHKDEYEFNKFFDAYLKGCVAWLPVKARVEQFNRMLNDSFLKNYLLQYFNELNHSSFNHLGYNPWDFMYIEHRTACFLSQIHVLNQVTFESVSLSNSRDVLNDMWGVDDQDIIKTSILYNSILNEYDEGEKDKNLGPEYIKSEELDPVSRELVYSGVYLLKNLITSKRWADASRLIREIFVLDPQVRYIYEYCFSVFYETKEFNEMLNCARYIMTNARLRRILNYQWIERTCNRLRSVGLNGVVCDLAEIFCVAEPALHWAWKQMAHVTESSNQVKALEYVKTAYDLNSDDQWNTTLYIRLLRKNGQLNDLLGLLEKISVYNEKKIWHFQLLGKIYHELKLFGESRFWIESGLKNYPNDPTLANLR